MENDPRVLEKEAHRLLAEEKHYDAYLSFRRAGDLYKENSRHKEAALCLASAASCWAIKSGEKIFYNASRAFEDAARESEMAGDLEYASLLYRQAAINFERDMEFLNFSECFYASKECLRKFLARSLFAPQKIHPIGAATLGTKGAAGFLRRLWMWFALTVSYVMWGHGERPVRPLGFGVLLIVLCSLVYWHGPLLKGGEPFQPTFSDAFYFSMVTFTTVGYGDMTAVGWSRLMVIFEIFCSLVVAPLFMIALTRKYLRV